MWFISSRKARLKTSIGPHRRSCLPCLEVLEDRTAPASLTFTSGEGDAFASSGGNDFYWFGPGAPAGFPFHNLSAINQGQSASLRASNIVESSAGRVNVGPSGTITAAADITDGTVCGVTSNFPTGLRVSTERSRPTAPANKSAIP